MNIPTTKLLYRKCRIDEEGKYCGKYGRIVAIMQSAHGTAVKLRFIDDDVFDIHTGSFVKKWFNAKRLSLVGGV